MTQKRGKGKGPADWQNLVGASAPEDMAPAPEKVKTRGPRKAQAPQEKAPVVPESETTEERRRPLVPTPPPLRARPKRKQFNNRLREDLIDRVKGEAKEWEEAGYVRTQSDILEDALTLYYEMKDEEQS